MYFELHVVFVTVSMLVYALVAAMLAPIVRVLVHLLQRRPVQASQRRVRLAAGLAAMLALAVIAIEYRPLVALATAAQPPPTPGPPLTRMVRDADGNIWLVDVLNRRYLIPDPETYRWYGGPPSPGELPEIDESGLTQLIPSGPAPSMKDAEKRRRNGR